MMMGAQNGDDNASPRKKRKLARPQATSYILRKLLDKVPLDTEGEEDVHITCVEYWNENLYIGTSAAEVLHFVSLPSDHPGESSEPSFILATRLPITAGQNSTATQTAGVQQIVLLPSANKACILCNGTVTFYHLPELSPAFGTKVGNCRWIGGLDLNQSADEPTGHDPVIMIAIQSRIMLVRIGEEAKRIRAVEFPGCLIASRRDTIACVADQYSYSLVDVEHQQKIPLFFISSSNDPVESGHVEGTPSKAESSIRRSSSISHRHQNSGKVSGHGRSTSLNAFVGSLGMRPQSPLRGQPDRSSFHGQDLLGVAESPKRSISQERAATSISKDLPSLPTSELESDKQKPLPQAPKRPLPQLKPHIATPTSSEFLLITGTEVSEPGVGICVNLDGDVVRGAIEFQRYPEAVIIDRLEEANRTSPNGDRLEGYVLAVISVEANGESRKCLEIQRWDIDPEGEWPKELIEIPTAKVSQSLHVGICHTTGPIQLNFYELGELLRIVRLKIPKTGASSPLEETDPRTKATIEQLRKEKELFESQELTDTEGSKRGGHADPGWEAQRNKEEAAFAHGLGGIRNSLVMWSGDRVWHVLKNPLPLQLNESLQKASALESSGRSNSVDREYVINLIQPIRDTEARSEAEFLGLEYVRQKAGLLLFLDLLSLTPDGKPQDMIMSTEEILLASSLDPRVILLFIPLLRDEVVQGPQGIWVHGGIAQIAETYLERLGEPKSPLQSSSAVHRAILDIAKHFLLAWQRKRGYGSVTDEKFVFDSIDAALLHLLLQQQRDSQAMRGSESSANVRAELNKLVDNWKGNFDRAVALLEQYNQLFVLSRLYQSRKMAGNVLKTWRRIVVGEKETDSEINSASVEVQIRKYLVKIRDRQLIEDYGTWLAARNPNLGIQVFADDSSRVKLEPPEVIGLLKRHAPNAVQDYLEHLVFSKNCGQYADDLIAYYLDTVLSVLQSSPTARRSLSESYSTYRALRPPKPTYLNFITENAPSEEWWNSRLRLLQLLGGGPSTHFTSFPTTTHLSYSIPTVLARIEPFQDELVSESIILDGRQGRHREALRLLTHGLGDYDSAIRYCIFRGSPNTEARKDSLIDSAAIVAEQSELFKYLLSEFLQIDDSSDRIEQVGDLLSRFGSWFDVREVLTLVPDDWSVEILSGFLVPVFRGLVSQAREARIQRGLSASLNLRIVVEHLEGVEKTRGWIEDEDGLRGLRDGARLDDSQEERGGHDGDASDFGDMAVPSAEGG